MSARNDATSAAFDLITSLRASGVVVLRDDLSAQTIPPAGLVIFRDGEPGEPEITLNPRSEYYQHRAEIEIFAPPGSGGEAILYDISSRIEALLSPDRTLAGKVLYSYLDALTLDRLDIEGSAQILTLTQDLVLEYVEMDPLDA